MIGDYDNRIGRPCSTNSSFTRRDVFQSKWVISQSEDEKTMAKPYLSQSNQSNPITLWEFVT